MDITFTIEKLLYTFVVLVEYIVAAFTINIEVHSVEVREAWGSPSSLFNSAHETSTPVMTLFDHCY